MLEAIRIHPKAAMAYAVLLAALAAVITAAMVRHGVTHTSAFVYHG